MSHFDGKVALVTGGSSGMGAATAAHLAKGGARVFCAQRSASAHDDILADLSDPTVPEQVIGEVEECANKLDILVNCAGLMREGTVEESPLEDWHTQLQINLTAPFLMTRYAMPMLRKSRGAIVNVGSIEGLGNNPRHPA